MSKSKDVAIPDAIHGFTQTRLDVDLATGEIKESKLSDEFCRDWIGGYGFAAKVLWDELEPGVDPLGPDNVLIYAHGPFPTTILPIAIN